MAFPEKRLPCLQGCSGEPMLENPEDFLHLIRCRCSSNEWFYPSTRCIDYYFKYISKNSSILLCEKLQPQFASWWWANFSNLAIWRDWNYWVYEDGIDWKLLSYLSIYISHMIIFLLLQLFTVGLMIEFHLSSIVCLVVLVSQQDCRIQSQAILELKEENYAPIKKSELDLINIIHFRQQLFKTRININMQSVQSSYMLCKWEICCHYFFFSCICYSV